MNARPERIGLVWFNDAAHLELALSLDRAAFRAALGRVTVRELTRLELGIAAGRAALDRSRRRPDTAPVLLVLTDGRANPGPPSLAEAEAAAAKADGVTVFSVGIGEAVDETALRAIASSPAHYVHAPDGEDLPAAYATVRAALPCPGSAMWPREVGQVGPRPIDDGQVERQSAPSSNPATEMSSSISGQCRLMPPPPIS